MYSKIIILSTIIFISVFSPVHASDLPYKPGELMVRFAPKADGKKRALAECNAVLAAIDGGAIKHSFKLVHGLTLVKLPENITVESAIAKFKKVNGILYAEPNYKIKLFSEFPNDTRFNELWGMHNGGQLYLEESGFPSSGMLDADIDAPEAWEIATDSNIVVAVIDTGVGYTHPDLNTNMWVNLGEIPDNGLDDDGNGYVDDIYGYDFSGYTPDDQDSDPNDEYGHGTHCAGIIGAVGNNGEGVTGVCWNVRIMALKIMPPYSGNWEALVSNAVEAIDYSVVNGANIINASWGIGTNYSQALKETIEDAGDAGVLFIAAAGNAYFANNNDINPIFPASYECNNIISVLATNDNDKKWSESNYGANSVDLGAPGVAILSCEPGGDYQYMSGTSMAAPHVAGACALAWSVNPLLGHLEVKDIILGSVDELDALDGRCLTGGRLNLYNAVLDATKQQQLLGIDDNLGPGNPINPYDEITYTINYANPITDPCDPNYIGTLTGVSIIDYLPEEMHFISASGPNTYDIFTNTVTYDIGTLEPNESNNSVMLTVVVNELAEPLGKITNVCALGANEISPITSVEITDVNSWNPGVIYVDVNATGSNTGMLWSKAYRYLQDALDRAGAACGSQICVAAGTYRPSKRTESDEPESATFQLVSGVSIYGRFPSGGGIRDWTANETILDGYLGGYYVDYVVLAQNVNGATTLDGFTVTNGDTHGIHCLESNPNITNCYVGLNNYKGIYCSSSDPNIINCNIEYNYSNGIYCENYSSPNIINCRIEHSGESDATDSGIICYNHSNPNIINCVIAENGNYLNYYGGGILCNNYSSPMITNCIFKNNEAIHGGGIYNASSSPTLTNCIIWDNSPDEIYGSGVTVTFSDVNSGWAGDGHDNINTDPCFYNPSDPNGYHLTADSPCIDKGNNSAVPTFILTDIDGEDRIMDGDSNGTVIVDMGADEYYWSPADFDRDEVVNFVDYAIFANAWLSEPGEPEWNPRCDISNPVDSYIDYNDLALLCKDLAVARRLESNVRVYDDGPEYGRRYGPESWHRRGLFIRISRAATASRDYTA